MDHDEQKTMPCPTCPGIAILISYNWDATPATTVATVEERYWCRSCHNKFKIWRAERIVPRVEE